MQHRTLEELDRVANVISSGWTQKHKHKHKQRSLSKRQRLERWAEALDQRKGQVLKSLVRTEFASRREREFMREDNSPLTVAFEDPVLRAEGLKSDRLGDAMRFFGLSNAEAHRILCYCHYGATILPETVSRCVRATALQADRVWWTSARGIFWSLSAAVGLTLAAILV